MSSKRVVDEDEIRESVCLNGDPASSIGKILYELYITRLTATRAAYLEEINAAALAQGAGSVASNAQVDSLLRAVADIVRSGGSGDLAAILADVTGINGSAMLTAANVWETNISAYSGAGYAGTYLKTLYDDWLNGGRLDLLIDSIITYVDCLPASMGDIVTKNLAHILSDSSAFAGADIATIKGQTDTKDAGRPQVFVKSITSAANAGDVTIATIITQPCIIDSIVLHANTAAQTDLTSAAISGGASKVVTFIDATDAAKANIDAIDEQVAWTGAVRLAATKTVVISLVGGGATAVDFTIIITYHAEVDGGYLS